MYVVSQVLAVTHSYDRNAGRRNIN